MRRRIVITVVVAGLVASAVALADVGSWKAGPKMQHSRGWPTATVLPNGEVLVAGGLGNLSAHRVTYLKTAELYNPSTGQFAAAASMSSARFAHTATALLDGRVLVTGGANGLVLRSAELYDYKTNSWSHAAPMAHPRVNQAATLLLDGRVLVTGGSGPSGAALRSAELYDPATNRWTAAADMHVPRYHQTATLLGDGRVLVAGGEQVASDGTPILYRTAELYNPTTNKWTLTGSMAVPRANQVASLLGNGDVLEAGGGDLGIYSKSAEFYDPSTGRWHNARSMCCRRAFASATELKNGEALVTGGFAGQKGLAIAEVYDPATNKWLRAGEMHATRGHQAAALLQDGQVFVVGGQTYNGPFLASSDLYTP